MAPQPPAPASAPPKPGAGPRLGKGTLPPWVWVAAAGVGLLIGIFILRKSGPSEAVAGEGSQEEASRKGGGGGGAIPAELLQAFGLTPAEDGYVGDDGGWDYSGGEQQQFTTEASDGSIGLTRNPADLAAAYFGPSEPVFQTSPTFSAPISGPTQSIVSSSPTFTVPTDPVGSSAPTGGGSQQNVIQ